MNTERSQQSLIEEIEALKIKVQIRDYNLEMAYRKVAYYTYLCELTEKSAKALHNQMAGAGELESRCDSNYWTSECAEEIKLSQTAPVDWLAKYQSMCEKADRLSNGFAANYELARKHYAKFQAEQDAHEETKQELNYYKTRTETLLSVNTRMYSENDALKKQLDQAMHERNNAMAEAEWTEAMATALAAERAELKNQVDELRQTIIRLTIVAADMKAKALDAEGRAISTQNELDGANIRIALLTEQNDRLTTEIGAVCDMLEQSELEESKLIEQSRNDQNAELRRQMVDLQAERDTLAKSLQSCKVNHSVQVNLNAQLAAQSARYSGMVAELQRELETYYK